MDSDISRFASLNADDSLIFDKVSKLETDLFPLDTLHTGVDFNAHCLDSFALDPRWIPDGCVSSEEDRLVRVDGDFLLADALSCAELYSNASSTSLSDAPLDGRLSPALRHLVSVPFASNPPVASSNALESDSWKEYLLDEDRVLDSPRPVSEDHSYSLSLLNPNSLFDPQSLDPQFLVDPLSSANERPRVAPSPQPVDPSRIVNVEFGNSACRTYDRRVPPMAAITIKREPGFDRVSSEVVFPEDDVKYQPLVGEEFASPATFAIKTEPVDVETMEEASTLPPTPLATSSSESEGSASPKRYPASSPARPPPNRLFFAAKSPAGFDGGPSSKRRTGSGGVVTVGGGGGIYSITEEERRTLIQEGLPVPTVFPLSKAEERCLKKVRRKIKNKLSAQESRRKKKEYLDSLEIKLQNSVAENAALKKRLETMEGNNKTLMSQIAKLNKLVRASKLNQGGSS